MLLHQVWIPNQLAATLLQPALRQPLSPQFRMEYGEEALPEHSACWGAELNGGVRCPADFVPGKLHFKNNFCDNCRDGIMVPVAHVRALSAEQAACFTNKFSKGFWNVAPAALGGGQYRIINNTAGCIGPWLAVFQSDPPHLAWSAHAREH